MADRMPTRAWLRGAVATVCRQLESRGHRVDPLMVEAAVLDHVRTRATWLGVEPRVAADGLDPSFSVLVDGFDRLLSR